MCGKILPSSLIIFAGMAELADAQDLGSCVHSCRFKSCYPYQQKGAFAPFSVGTGNRLAESHRILLAKCHSAEVTIPLLLNNRGACAE